MGKPFPIPEKKNPRGIPEAPFLENIAEYASNADEATTLVGKMQEMLQKYKLMEMATANRLKKFEANMPNLKKTSESIAFLQEQEAEFETNYALDETVFAKAVIPPTQKVWLWLGANVMLEFPLDEAKEMMDQKVSDAAVGIKAAKEDLEFLKENTTTMEVNTARAINHQVALRASAK